MRSIMLGSMDAIPEPFSLRRWHHLLLSWPYFALVPLHFHLALEPFFSPHHRASSPSFSRHCHSFLVPFAGRYFLYWALAALAS
jgi:hypothetical protein